MVLRLAMWSGPRNISTAMMRSWGNRADTFVCDEPLYAYYLAATKSEHPGREQVIAAGETDWRKVVRWLSEDAPEGKAIFFQKHMTHHLLPEVDREWLRDVTNCFLIRDPREVIVSYLRKNRDPTAEDLGYPQQTALFHYVQDQLGSPPPVLDARDVLHDPARTLGQLCDALNIPFDANMLSWPPGPRATDGIWARWWYSEVEQSTGFKAPSQSSAIVPEHLRDVYDECRAHYELLYPLRLN